MRLVLVKLIGYAVDLNPPEKVDREFFLRKVEECIRYAEEATPSAARGF